MRRAISHVRVGAFVLLLALAPVAGGFVAGCSTKTTTVTERTGEDGEVETTVTEEREIDRPTGIISTGFNLIGEIIALPFRIVAGVVQLIF